MTATQYDTIAELQRANAELRQELGERDAALAQRKTDFDERIEHQVATTDVLKAMSASPADTQPVFDLITSRAAELCESRAALWELRDGQMQIVSSYGTDPAILAAFRQHFPKPPDRSFVVGRAVLDRQITHIRDVAADPALSQATRDLGATAVVGIPLLRDGAPIGAIALSGRHPGGFSDTQIALLQTFAEQAVIAITSAETYRGLHEALEQQTATAEVLQVINASPGDLSAGIRRNAGKGACPLRVGVWDSKRI